jgi:hypothetical protein
VYEESEDTVPKFKHVYISHRQIRNPPTDPSTMPTIVPGEGPEFILPYVVGIMDGVFCLRIKSASFEVRVGRVLSRARRWDDVRGARLARREDARELRAERMDEDVGIGAIARSSLEGEYAIRSCVRCDANALLS